MVEKHGCAGREILPSEGAGALSKTPSLEPQLYYARVADIYQRALTRCQHQIPLSAESLNAACLKRNTSMASQN